ncbi:cysteine-rich RLK (RECEPTOR-like protein kinase) 8 [Hibiscus trionum]|uniref:Cysteine-rich RLK (RECEPTOR-like protein kinase) 8 n=1 Tax=Hibiscus trionum TaxID=183268 RepID=A0A9W7M3W1_HIBTR|nr:cysteine-rich RLK (RECEPTOR-like protein kinase) 8 [Hibiscus trionum]
MQEELNQFERSNVWTLVERPSNQSTIGTKWVFRNKLDESGNIVRKKARLVAQDYTQEEGIDFDETYAPVARMEAIRMLLAYACYHDFKLFQMDVKSTFLNGFINEEVFQASPRESHLIAVKRIFRYLRDTPCLGLWYPRDSTFNLHTYSDVDYGGCKIDRKNTSETCQFLGSMLISWFCKKQNSVALSTTEAEYISLGSCCAQVLWMEQQLLDYGIKVETIPLKCDNTSAICLTKNPIQHSRTKHIEIRHHFIRDHVLKEDVVIEYVDTLNQLADIFTKPLDKERFWSLRRELGLTSLS